MWEALYSWQFNSVRVRKTFKQGRPKHWDIPMGTIRARNLKSAQFVAFIRNFLKIPEPIEIDFTYLKEGDRFHDEPPIVLEVLPGERYQG